MLALTADDIAPDGTTISITKAIKMVDGVPILGPPKSKRSIRTIPVPEDYQKHAIYLRNHSGKPYIWTSRRSTGLYDVGVFRKKYYRMLKGLPVVRKLSPHCLRHSYVSTLEQKGVPMEQIARLAGHTKVTTTDGYLHMDMTTLSNAVSVLNKNNA
jgi:integrase